MSLPARSGGGGGGGGGESRTGTGLFRSPRRLRTEGDDPDRWPVVIQSFDGEDIPCDCQTAEFVCRVLTGPDHPFTMAHYFDTHWFMSYAEVDRPLTLPRRQHGKSPACSPDGP